MNAIFSFFKRNTAILIVAGVTLIAIVLSAIISGANFITLMPLFVSLCIMVLQSEANRYAFLIGSINSIFYAVVDVSFTLYSSALSALLLSFPIQLITFIRWNKRAYKSSTKFSKFSIKGRLLLALLSAVFYVILNFALVGFGSKYMLIDNLIFVISMLTYTLTLLSFIEYAAVQFIGGALSLIMNICVSFDDPTRLPFLIYGVYSLVCIAKAVVSVSRLYKEQQIKADPVSLQK